MCGHSHISKTKFYDYSKKIPKKVNKRIVNIFEYFSAYLDSDSKKVNISKSIDLLINELAKRKEKKENLFKKLLISNSLN